MFNTFLQTFLLNMVTFSYNELIYIQCQPYQVKLLLKLETGGSRATLIVNMHLSFFSLFIYQCPEQQ